MPQWLRLFLDKHFTKIIHSPEVAYLGPIHSTEWAGLLAELAQGYEKHLPVFRAIQILLRQTESAMLRVREAKTADDLATQAADLRGLVREANAYRRILRLPIESQNVIAKKAQAEAAKKEKEEEEPAELD